MKYNIQRGDDMEIIGGLLGLLRLIASMGATAIVIVWTITTYQSLENGLLKSEAPLWKKALVICGGLYILMAGIIVLIGFMALVILKKADKKISYERELKDLNDRYGKR